MKRVYVDWGDCPARDNGCQADCHALEIFNVPDDWNLEKCNNELSMFRTDDNAVWSIESSQIGCYNASRNTRMKFLGKDEK